ncbi:MAG: Sec-independent protein translocase protein TatB [Alphaproteobacteria bacterium]|nr:Sec-independent protein translocase protein TatB [Alphaproteobacteria bacterium]MCW5743070.1 Sec-independent protein translocase protein TatB [Alphaproteobacteria bacterium]
MFGIDSPELLVILVVALIFIGPKELPGMLRTIGRWVAAARNLAGEFRGHVDDMVRQADLDEVKKTIDSNTALDLPGIDPMKEIRGQVDAGIAEAEAEMAQARAAIDASTTGAEAPSPVETAELVPPPAPEPIADPTPALEPSAVADPIPVEQPVPAEPQATADTPTPANEPGPPPAKVAVG